MVLGRIGEVNFWRERQSLHLAFSNRYGLPVWPLRFQPMIDLLCHPSENRSKGYYGFTFMSTLGCLQNNVTMAAPTWRLETPVHHVISPDVSGRSLRLCGSLFWFGQWQRHG